MAETKKIVRITAKRDGFRRCGVAHPGTPTDHPIDRFSKTELAALKGEAMLVVQVLEAREPDDQRHGRSA